MHRRTLGAVVGAILCLGALAGSASAATLTNAAGVLTYTATVGHTSVIGFQETGFNSGTGEADVTVYRDADNFDDDPITTHTGCAEDAGSDPDHLAIYNCTGVKSVVGTALDMPDILDAGNVGGPPDGVNPLTDFGGSEPRLAHIPVNFDLGAGDDFGNGGAASDTVNGGDGNDALFLDPGGAGGPLFGNDTGNGGNGDDAIFGARGNDTIDGQGGGDFLTGGPGSDTVNGGDGDDFPGGGPGNDTVNGGAGDDQLDGDCSPFPEHPFIGCSQPAGADVLNGGSGIDTVAYGDTDFSGPDPVAANVSVTLDDAANDGRSTDTAKDNVHADIENVQVVSPTTAGAPPGAPEGNATVNGTAAVNEIVTASGNDTVDPGSNNDIVRTAAGNDTINARDGFADFISCGEGSDVVNSDSFDSVDSSCETNNAVAATFATEDKPPSVDWTSPASGANLSNTASNTLTVNASDDKGISQVIFLDDERVVCTDTTAPYACDYKPQGDDVGRNTLDAVAVDTAQQTASKVRAVNVPRFTPTKLSSSTSPKSDTSGPRKFTTTGKLTLPTGVTTAQGCSGKVAVTFKAGKKTISTRRVNLSKSCTYRSKVTFAIPSRLAGTLQVVVRYAGNAVLAPKSAKRGKVKT